MSFQSCQSAWILNGEQLEGAQMFKRIRLFLRAHNKFSILHAHSMYVYRRRRVNSTRLLGRNCDPQIYRHTWDHVTNTELILPTVSFSNYDKASKILWKTVTCLIYTSTLRFDRTEFLILPNQKSWVQQTSLIRSNWGRGNLDKVIIVISETKGKKNQNTNKWKINYTVFQKELYKFKNLHKFIQRTFFKTLY
jgi:hypothetical protein